MPYDKGLKEQLEQVKQQYFSNNIGITENTMMGGFGYMLNGNMLIGIFKDHLILRVGKECSEKLLHEKHISHMDITGKVLSGWVKVDSQGCADEETIAKYFRYCLDFVSTLPIKQ